ncbi:putative SCY1 protein kinase [Blattamonas nauphoetae]|uniref:SCY1 protein kinase n=1 Tax=Blattamonas nauphoetae TaxID=2049346 RepID=A0ABQ9XXV0_9EUKA|nr:putative SCY1 protein kinase [Blattamonas nauphoetae]
MNWFFEKAANLTGIVPGSGGSSATMNLPGSVWSVSESPIKKKDQNLSIFSSSFQKGSEHGKLAQRGLQKIKSFRHPGILKIIDFKEGASSLSYTTEAAIPLFSIIKTLPEADITWGLHQIIKTLIFLADMNTTLLNLSTSTIFVVESNDWKLGCLELLTSDEEVVPLYGLLPSDLKSKVNDCLPPEQLSKGLNLTPEGINQLCSWSLGHLICDVFSVPFSPNAYNHAAFSKTYSTVLKRLLSPTPTARPTLDAILESPLFNTPLVSTLSFMEELPLKQEEEKRIFFGTFTQNLNEISQNLLESKILPSILVDIETSNSLHSITACFVILSHIQTVENTTKVFTSGSSDRDQQSSFNPPPALVPLIVKLFQTPVRAVRAVLLTHISSYIDLISPSVFQKQLFSCIMAGFKDTNPTLRELTVKTMAKIPHKVTPKQLRQEILRCLAASQNDPEIRIRGSSVICISLLLPSLNPSEREEVLLSSTLRAISDQTLPVRLAGINTIKENSSAFKNESLAQKIIPAISPFAVDRTMEVRKEVIKLLNIFIEALTKNSEQMTAQGLDASSAPPVPQQAPNDSHQPPSTRPQQPAHPLQPPHPTPNSAPTQPFTLPPQSLQPQPTSQPKSQSSTPEKPKQEYGWDDDDSFVVPSNTVIRTPEDDVWGDDWDTPAQPQTSPQFDWSSMNKTEEKKTEADIFTIKPQPKQAPAKSPHSPSQSKNPSQPVRLKTQTAKPQPSQPKKEEAVGWDDSDDDLISLPKMAEPQQKPPTPSRQRPSDDDDLFAAFGLN